MAEKQLNDCLRQCAGLVTTGIYHVQTKCSILFR